MSPNKSQERVKLLIGHSHDDLTKLADALQRDLSRGSDSVDRAVKLSEKRISSLDQNKRKVSPAKIGGLKKTSVTVGRLSLKKEEKRPNRPYTAPNIRPDSPEVHKLRGSPANKATGPFKKQNLMRL